MVFPVIPSNAIVKGGWVKKTVFCDVRVLEAHGGGRIIFLVLMCLGNLHICMHACICFGKPMESLYLCVKKPIENLHICMYLGNLYTLHMDVLGNCRCLSSFQ